jgi:hypothetical protein
VAHLKFFVFDVIHRSSVRVPSFHEFLMWVVEWPTTHNAMNIWKRHAATSTQSVSTLTAVKSLK